MSMSLELYEKVSGYANDEIDRSALEDWVVPKLAVLLSPLYVGIHDLVGEVELGLAELSRGDMSEEELKAALRSFLAQNAWVIRSGEDEHVSTSETSSVTSTFEPVLFDYISWRAPDESQSASETEVKKVELVGI